MAILAFSLPVLAVIFTANYVNIRGGGLRMAFNLFLFAVERDARGRDVRQQVEAILAGIEVRKIAEHARVRLCRDVQAEGYRLERGKGGTVVAIYGDGMAYAVEFADVDGEVAVVTIMADALVTETAA